MRAKVQQTTSARPNSVHKSGATKGKFMVSRSDSRKIAALHKEIDAIHIADSLYWKQGAGATTAERADYQ